MRLDRIDDDAVGSVVFEVPVLDRKHKTATGKYTITGEMRACVAHYRNQAIRTLKRMQGKACDWKILRERPRVKLVKAKGRKQTIDIGTELQLEAAFEQSEANGRHMRFRERSLIVLAVLMDTGQGPQEVFRMRIEDLRFETGQIYSPWGKTERATRLVPMSDRLKLMLQKCRGGEPRAGYSLLHGRNPATLPRSRRGLGRLASEPVSAPKSSRTRPDTPTALTR